MNSLKVGRACWQLPDYSGFSGEVLTRSVSSLNVVKTWTLMTRLYLVLVVAGVIGKGRT